jgi:hypothetical protein
MGVMGMGGGQVFVSAGGAGSNERGEGPVSLDSCPPYATLLYPPRPSQLQAPLSVRSFQATWACATQVVNAIALCSTPPSLPPPSLTPPFSPVFNLPAPHLPGAPLRVVVPGHVGVRNTKWLTEIEASDEDAPGVWQRGIAYKVFGPNVTKVSLVWGLGVVGKSLKDGRKARVRMRLACGRGASPTRCLDRMSQR